MPARLARILVAAFALLATVLFAALAMEGVVGFGAGEKDFFFALPLLPFWLVLLIANPIPRWRKVPPGRVTLLRALVSARAVAVARAVPFALIFIRGGAH
ncbi:MAG TPA: hypothetical protein VNM24_03275 [Burkholderiales bacterium]|nr:hypothetical protein [Burkholderiales bacterium]